MKYELKRVSVWSVIKISFVLNFILGFIVGLFYALILLALASLPASVLGEESGGIFSALAGVAVFLLPFLFAFFLGVIYTIAAAIAAFAYNLVAKVTGGFELEFASIASIVPIATAATYSQPTTGGETNATL